MIYILEGADGTGKTTLGREILDQTKGHLLHCTWKKGWNIKEYFDEVIKCAKVLNKYQHIVIDRWAPSEHVYGTVFRDSPQFDVISYLWEEGIDTKLKFIYCKNDNAVENHLKNKQERIEMFEDMSKIVKEFDEFVKDTSFLEWTTYDYNKVNMKEFVKELIDGRN